MSSAPSKLQLKHAPGSTGTLAYSSCPYGSLTPNHPQTDWIKDDLNFFPIKPYTKCVGCELHGGFYDSYFDLKPGILTAFEQLGTKPGDTLQITGHSLGAAMATIAAYDMLADGYKIAQSYTFGTPRVGNQAFADAYDAALGKQTMYRYVLGVYSQLAQQHGTSSQHAHALPAFPRHCYPSRVIHNADPVPHLPMLWMGFHHTATEVWYNEPQTSYVVCDGSGEDNLCADSLLLPIDVLDHLSYMNIGIGTQCGIPFNISVPALHAVEDPSMRHATKLPSLRGNK